MSGYLVDTNVVSEAQRSRPDAAVIRWLRDRRHRPLFVSVITLGEIRRGIEMLPEGPRRTAFDQALTRLSSSFLRRTIPIDAAIADRWGRLTAKQPNLGRRSIDALLAATAQEYDLTVATRNVRDFDDTGVRVANPWLD